MWIHGQASAELYCEIKNRLEVDAGRHQHDKTHGRTEFVRTPEMEKTIKDARQLMLKCSHMYTEEKCLQIFFGADYFWNKWKLKF